MLRDFKYYFLLCFSIFLLTKNCFPSSRASNSTGGGNWNNPTSWAGNILPICGDTIIIKTGDIICVTTDVDFSGCGSPMFMVINGTLLFNTNGVKLQLPAGSDIIVKIGGLISSPIKNNSKKIEIGGNVVWSGNQPDIMGPFSFGIVLSVNLSSFAAHNIDNKVTLIWITVNETNNDYFVIERANDAIHFEEIGRINGQGNSSNEFTYNFIDAAQYIGTVYYRLKQVDYEGEYMYSDIASISIKNNSITISSGYPNPATEKIHYKIFSEKNKSVLLKIITQMGAFVKLNEANVDKGFNVVDLDLSTLKKGVYFISFLEEDHTLISYNKIIKE